MPKSLSARESSRFLRALFWPCATPPISRTTSYWLLAPVGRASPARPYSGWPKASTSTLSCTRATRSSSAQPLSPVTKFATSKLATTCPAAACIYTASRPTKSTVAARCTSAVTPDATSTAKCCTSFDPNFSCPFMPATTVVNIMKKWP